MRQTQEIDFRQGINQDIAMSQHPQNKLFDLHNLRIIGRGTGEDFSLVNERGNENIYNFNNPTHARTLGQLYYFNPETLSTDIIDLSNEEFGNKDYQIKLSGTSAYRALNIIFKSNSSDLVNDYFVTSGSCGDYLKWALYKENDKTILVITSDNVNEVTSGIMYDFATTTNVPWRSYSSSITDLCILTDIKNIGKYAFSDCISLSNILYISDANTPSPLNIGFRAFYNCQSLAYFDFTNVSSIGEKAFEKCVGLESLAINTVNTSIGARAFYGCDGLQTVDITFAGNEPNNKQIGAEAFRDCTGTLTTTNSIPSISGTMSGVFSYSAFSKIIIKDASTIGNYAFSALYDSIPNNDRIKNVSCDVSFDIVSQYISNVTINSYAFAGRHGYNFDKIHYKINNIGPHAFEECWSIIMLDLRDRPVTLGEGAFNKCVYLNTLYLGNYYYSIGKEAFAKCGNLKDVYVDSTSPSTTYILGNDVFKRAPEDFTSIGNYNYISISDSTLYCPSGSESTYGNAPQWKEFGFIYPNESINSISISPETISVRTDAPTVFTAIFDPVEASAAITWTCTSEHGTATIVSSGNICTVVFSNAPSHNVATYTLTATVTQGSAVFTATSTVTATSVSKSGTCGTNVNYYIYGDTLELEGSGPTSNYATGNVPWEDEFSTIKKVKISNGITYLGNNLFYRCSSVEEFILPDSVTSISVNAFSYCKGAIHVNNSLPDYAFIVGSLLRHVVLGENITTIPDNAFNGAFFSTIEIKGNITSVGTRAFANCSNLIHFELTSTSTVTFGDNVFEDCTSLITFKADAPVNSVGTSIFARCHNLSKIQVGAGGAVTAPRNALIYNGMIVAGCKNSEITHSVAAHAFEGNESIEELFVDDVATNYTIGERAFSGCTNLKKIYFGGTLFNIGNYAFENCTSLDTIVFTTFGITTIQEDNTEYPITSNTLNGNYVFSGCTNLTKVYSQSRIPIGISSTFFGGIGNTNQIKCYIPCVEDSIPSSYTDYRMSPNWKALVGNEITNFIQISTSFPEVSLDGETYINKIDYKLKYSFTVEAGVDSDTIIPFIWFSPQDAITGGGRLSIEHPSTTIYGHYPLYTNDATWRNCYKNDGWPKSITPPENYLIFTINADLFNTKASGYCGTDLQYAIIETTNNDTAITTMYLIGTGKMSDYSLWWYPWKEVETNIDVIDISNSLVTKYAYHTFRYTNALTNGAFSDGTLVNASSASGEIFNSQKIAAYAFYNNTSITGFIYSGTSIGYSAFEGCSNLSYIEISNVNSIFETFGDYSGCFTGCNSLIKADLTAAVEGTGSIEVIPYGLFTNCDNLKYIYLPDSVTYLDSVALNCKSVERIKCFAETPPTLPYTLTEPENLNIDIYVPDSKTDDYKTNASWRKYNAHIFAISNYPEEDFLLNVRPVLTENVGISLNISNTSVSRDTDSLMLLVEANGFTPNIITWNFSDDVPDDNIIDNINEGLVTFKKDEEEHIKIGRAVITATADNQYTATCTIDIVDNSNYKRYSKEGLEAQVLANVEDNIPTITASITCEDQDAHYPTILYAALLNDCLGKYGFSFTNLGGAQPSIDDILNNEASKTYNFLAEIPSYARGVTTGERCNIIGAQTIGDYLVLFIVAHVWAYPDEEDPYDTDEKYDYIIRLTQIKDGENAGKFDPESEKILYKGNLNFSEENPIESIAIYEANDIQKIYWIDGRNQPRLINIVSDSINQTDNDTQFDFSRTFNDKSIPVVEISSEASTTGKFEGGVIHYIITYVSKNGSESSVVYLSPAQYVWKESKFGSGRIAVSPTDTSNIMFTIEVKNVDTNYDMINIYRASRSEYGSNNIVLVTKNKITSDTFVYVDTGTSLGTESSFDGGSLSKSNIIPHSISYKDDMLFLGNIHLKMSAMLRDTNIANLISINNGNRRNYGFYLKEIEETDGNRTSNKGVFTNYKASLTSSIDNSYYQYGETYRFGLQLLYNTGQWSPVYYFGEDFKNEYRVVTSKYQDTLKSKPMFRYKMPRSVADTLKKAGFIGARLVYVPPTLEDRHVLCQGVLCSTLYNVKDRKDGKYVIYPSWFVRPEFKSYDTLIKRIGDRAKSNGRRGQYLETRMTDGNHLIALPGAIFPNSEFQLQPSGEIRTSDTDYYVVPSSTPIENNRDAFAIEKSVVDIYSPDIQFGDLTPKSIGNEWNLRVVGYCTDKGFRSYTRVVAGAPLKIKGGFKYKDVLTISATNTIPSNNDFGGGSLASFPYWTDGMVEKLSDTQAIEETGFWIFNKESLSNPLHLDATFPIYTWHTNQVGYNNSLDARGKITSKAMANIKTTWTTTYFSNIKDPNSSYTDVSFDKVRALYMSSGENGADDVEEFKGVENDVVIRYNKRVHTSFRGGQGFNPIYTRVLSFRTDKEDVVNPYSEPTTPLDKRFLETSQETFPGNRHILTEVYQGVNFGYNDRYCSIFDFHALGLYQGQQYYPASYMYTPSLGAIIIQDSNESQTNESQSMFMLNTTNSVSMRYTSVPHITMILPKTAENKRWILPKLTDTNSVITKSIAQPNSVTLNEVYTNLNNAHKSGCNFEAIDFSTADSFYGSGLSQYIISVPKGSNGIEDDSHKQPYYLIGELYRDYVPNAYGGMSDLALLNNQWAICSDTKIFPENTDDISEIPIETTEGDTYFGRYDVFKTYPIDSLESATNNLTEVLSITCESHINMAGRYDDNINSIDRTLSELITWNPKEVNLVNKEYSLYNNIIPPSYIPEDAAKRSEFPNQIIWSDKKNRAEDVDTWTNIGMVNTMYLDGDKGAITSLQRFGNEIYAFQERGISRILYNSRTMIPSSDNMPIELSNAGNVQGKYYISESIGCQNKWSIANTPYGIYFVDDNFKDIWLFNGKELQNVSKLKGMSSWVNANSSLFSWNVKDYKGIRSLYDQNTKEVHFMTNDIDNSLAYNEDLGAFSGFYSYGGSDFMFSLGEYTYQIKDGSIWRLRTGNRGMFFNEVKPYSITAIVNGSDKGLNEFDKIFETVDFIGDTYRLGELTNNMESPFTHIRAWNEYQDTTTKLLKYTPVFDKDSYLKRKFRTWRVQVPRNTIGSGRRVTLDRIRNQWSKIELSYDPTTLEQGVNMPKSVIKGMKANYFIP